MAEGKKSFILYLTQRPIFDGLSDEDAGKLIKTIFAYCADEHPQPEGMTGYSFNIIKPILKSDLASYEDKKEKNKENARKRWEKEKSKTMQTDANECERMQTNADIVIDNDIDIVIDNVNDSSKEEINNVSISSKESILTCPEVSSKPSDMAVISLILNNKKYFNVSQEAVDHYQELYPKVDCVQELRNMCGWLESNPNNRKTESGVKAFITRWLAKCQNSGKTTANNTYISELGPNGGFTILNDNYDGLKKL